MEKIPTIPLNISSILKETLFLQKLLLEEISICLNAGTTSLKRGTES